MGGATVEESVQYATHSGWKPSQISFQEHWWVEACLAILPNNRLVVAKHTHRLRHGTVKH